MKARIKHLYFYTGLVLVLSLDPVLALEKEASNLVFNEASVIVSIKQKEKIKSDMLAEYTCHEFRTKASHCEPYQCQAAILSPQWVSTWKIIGQKGGQCEISETRQMTSNKNANDSISDLKNIQNSQIAQNTHSEQALYEPTPWTTVCQYDGPEVTQLATEIETITHDQWPNPYGINTLGKRCEACRFDPKTGQKFCTAIHRSMDTLSGS